MRMSEDVKIRCAVVTLSGVEESWAAFAHISTPLNMTTRVGQSERSRRLWSGHKVLVLPALLLTMACANEQKPVEPPVAERSIAEATVAFEDKAVKIIEKKNVEYAYPRWSKDGSKILFQSNET